MPTSLRLLMIEDSEKDEILVARLLRKEWPDLVIERVQTRAEMDKALDSRDWDAILCDIRLPNFSPQDALEILRERGLDSAVSYIAARLGPAPGRTHRHPAGRMQCWELEAPARPGAAVGNGLGRAGSVTRSRSAKVSTPSNQDCKRRVLFTLPVHAPMARSEPSL